MLPAWLRRAGYRTAHVGKFLNGYERAVTTAEVAPGWDVWYTTLGATRYFDYDVSANGRRIHFGTAPVARHPRAQQQGRDADPALRPGSDAALPAARPPRSPHGDRDQLRRAMRGPRRPGDPPRREGRPRSRRCPMPPSFNEADVTDKPSFIRDRPLLSEGRVKKITKRYDCAIGALRSVDRGIKQIVRALKQVGELGNTVLVFTSDNGFYFGEHRIARDKTHPYEEGIRVPLMIRIPGAAPGGCRSFRQVRRAGGEHRPGAHLPRSRRRGLVRARRPGRRRGGGLPGDGRALADAAADRHPRMAVEPGLLVEYDGAGSKGTSSCKYDGIRLPGRFYVEHVEVPDPLTGICRRGRGGRAVRPERRPVPAPEPVPEQRRAAAALGARLDGLRGLRRDRGAGPGAARGPAVLRMSQSRRGVCCSWPSSLSPLPRLPPRRPPDQGSRTSSSW